MFLVAKRFESSGTFWNIVGLGTCYIIKIHKNTCDLGSQSHQSSIFHYTKIIIKDAQNFPKYSKMYVQHNKTLCTALG